MFDAFTFLFVIVQIARMHPSPPSDEENEVSWEAIKEELGQKFDTVRRWCLAAGPSRALAPVRVVAPKLSGSAAVTGWQPIPTAGGRPGWRRRL